MKAILIKLESFHREIHKEEEAMIPWNLSKISQVHLDKNLKLIKYLTIDIGGPTFSLQSLTQ